jgi:hypothetical protein
VDLEPPAPWPTYLAAAARHLAAVATTDGPASAPGPEPADERALFSQVTRPAAAQVAMPQEEVATHSADENAPKEIQFATATAAPGDAAGASEETIARLLALAPPPPRPTYLVEAARRLAALAITDHAAPEPAAERALLCEGAPAAATQVAIPHKEVTTHSAQKNAPKEIPCGRANAAPAGCRSPAADCEAGVAGPPGTVQPATGPSAQAAVRPAAQDPTGLPADSAAPE